MRLLRSSLYWGLCPQTPGIYRCSRQNSCVASQLGAAPPNPQDTAGGRRVHRLPAIPAAESALGLRPRIALSSAQVLPEWTTMASPCNNFSANGDCPLTSCLTPGVHFIPPPLHVLTDLSSPQNGAVLPGATVTFTWNSVAGADKYWLDVGNKV